MRAMIGFVLIFLLYGLVDMTYVHQNIMFKKLNEVSTTRSKWLISFIIDLEPYHQFLGRLSEDINNTLVSTNQVLRRHNETGPGGYAVSVHSTISKLQTELASVYTATEELLSKFIAYRKLRTKNKRAILPIVGKALSFLFGTVSDGDLSAIRGQVGTLASNQQKITHVLEESLTIQNITRTQVEENRQGINNIINSFTQLNHRLLTFTNGLQRRVAQVEEFMHIFMQLDMVVEEIRFRLQSATFFTENMRSQLDMLALGHVSPSIISPTNLQNLLADLETKLPLTMKLPHDPTTHLWDYYEFLTCTTVMENDKIMIITSVPLLDISGKFEIFRAINLPLPLKMTSKAEISAKTMTAKYHLEAETVALNIEKTKYVILEEDEVEQCSKHINFCHMRYPVYPTNLSEMCVIAFLTKDDKKISKYCKTIVEPFTPLPAAQYLDRGIWVVTTNEPARFSVICQLGIDRVSSKIVQPPIGIIKLEPTCSATNDKLSFLPFYESMTAFEIQEDWKNLILMTNVSKFKLWEPFHAALPNFTKVELPSKLKEIKHIPMTQLIDELRTLRSVTNETEFPFWGFVGMGAVGLGVIVLLIYISKRFGLGRLMCKNRLAMRERKRSGKPITEEPHFEMVPLAGKGDDSEDRPRPTAPLVSEEQPNDYVAKIYPGVPKQPPPTKSTNNTLGDIAMQ